MINVWVTGSEGQLGRKIKNNANQTGINFLFTTKGKVDLTIKNQIKSFIKINKIDLIINCAAYTDVEGAEQNSNLAYDINSNAVLNLVEYCKELIAN